MPFEPSRQFGEWAFASPPAASDAGPCENCGGREIFCDSARRRSRRFTRPLFLDLVVLETDGAVFELQSLMNAAIRRRQTCRMEDRGDGAVLSRAVKASEASSPARGAGEGRRLNDEIVQIRAIRPRVREYS